MNNIIKKLALTLVFMCLLAPLINHRIGYIFLGLLSLMGLIYIGKIKIPNKLSDIFILILPILIFLSWIYGVFVGLLRGNNIEYVFTNFIGLAFYLAFYGLLASKITSQQLIRCLFIAALIYFVYGTVLLGESLFFGGYFSILSASSISDYRVLYLAPTIYFVPFIVLGMLRLSGAINDASFSSWSTAFPIWITSKSFLLLLSVVFVLTSMSKSFIAIIFIVIFICIILALRNTCYKLRIRPVFFITMLLIATRLFMESDIFELLIFSFSNSESSNSVRSEQYEFLIDELSFFGAGLGAVLKSGYIRNSIYPYGFELTFINILNKLGILAMPIFIAYFYPIISGIKNILYKDGDIIIIGGITFGSMLYVIAGLANPLLFSTNFIMLHCICLFLLINLPKTQLHQ